MKIAFVDFSGWDYNTDDVSRMPLGGSQSALCNLANALVKLGHQVFLLNQTSHPGKYSGVECIHMHNIPRDVLQDLDVLAIQNQAGMGEQVKDILNDRTALILWTQHDRNQPSVQKLQDSAEKDIYDAIVFVSDWQRNCFCEHFGIDPSRTRVLRNAIGLPFYQMFDRTSGILTQKSQPLVLAYTSTPFRGLDLLLEVFPQIRQAIPGTRLKVFSSMKVYQVSENQDESKYGELYEKCRQTEGVEYIGSLPQADLAGELKSIAVLAYPNTFAETSCIAVMEAMASGCYVVTSHLGALPETTAGFARLIPVEGDWETYKTNFVEQTIEILTQISSSKVLDTETHLRQQVESMNRDCIWSVRAREWVEVLEQITTHKAKAKLDREDLSTQAYQCLVEGECDRAKTLYEQAIEINPANRSNYWHLGLVLLLQGQEADAQTTWLSVMMEAGEEESQVWMSELLGVLQNEARRQETLSHWQMAWVIRQHIREIVPEDLNNWLQLAVLSANLELRSELDSTLEKLREILSLGESETHALDRDILLETLKKALEFEPAIESVIWLSEFCVRYAADSPEFRQLLIRQTTVFLQENILPKQVLTRYAEIYLSLQPNNLPVLVALINLYQDTQRYAESFELAEAFINRTENLPDRIAAYYLLLRGLMKAGGNFNKVRRIHQEYEKLIVELIESDLELDRNHIIQLITTTLFGAYLDDDVRKNKKFNNDFSSFMQSKIRKYFVGHPQTNTREIAVNKNKILKIGYLSSGLRRNSVGYLVRWTLQNHDRTHFQTFAYSLQKTEDEVQQFIATQVSKFRDLSRGITIPEIAQIIHQDEIDILVDLDSLTSGVGCAVMALKPAPIQLTWLGFDASGLPAIDYFLVDSYVLPDSAQDYYTEKIWRLPQTYIAVDGFEVGVPTLRREQLEIPKDAIVYFSSQTGGKRHPDNVRSQLQILKAVPNSYLLIKGLHTDLESVRRFFEQIATEEGVKCDRLRFLPAAPSEAIHRANISIADVVLDTYPYNGTTTTLETLWMEVPVVTRVGEQFASRQGYTLLTNAGIEEGIAWTDEAYIEWGIRLGTDSQLRQKIAWKLRQSKQISPLWNTAQFTRELEKAYQQMWHQYLGSIA